MVFFEYFKTRLGQPVTITLKNDMVLTGTLTNVDPFLNMRIEGGSTAHLGVQGADVYSVRGSAIKTIAFASEKMINERLADITRIKWCLDAKE